MARGAAPAFVREAACVECAHLPPTYAHVPDTAAEDDVATEEVWLFAYRYACLAPLPPPTACAGAPDVRPVAGDGPATSDDVTAAGDAPPVTDCAPGDQACAVSTGTDAQERHGAVKRRQEEGHDHVLWEYEAPWPDWAGPSASSAAEEWKKT